MVLAYKKDCCLGNTIIEIVNILFLTGEMKPKCDRTRAKKLTCLTLELSVREYTPVEYTKHKSKIIYGTVLRILRDLVFSITA